MSSYHVFPVGDYIDHDAGGEDCVCGPSVEVLVDGGPMDWLYLHHSLDGRELTEKQS